MLLETLDLLTDDVVIYSENIFDLKENYRIIFKQAEIKRPQKVEYSEVCNYVRMPLPKNIIVYRLLTSIAKMDAYRTKYGYFINTFDKLELVYFDPIFAIKDIDNLIEEINPSDFRFKIQQVGFTTAGEKNGECMYSEVYAFDLRAIEAQNQNDKVYAHAIFALDDTFVDDSDDAVFIKNPTVKIIEADQHKQAAFSGPSLSQNIRKTNINESKIMDLKMSFSKEWDSVSQVSGEKIPAHKKSHENEEGKSSLSSFLAKYKSENKSIGNRGIFGSDESNNISKRDSVILKFK